MWHSRRATEALNIRYPVIQGPFGGGFSSTNLVAAVSNAGGLGSFGAHNLTGDQIRSVATEIREKTDKPFALNLWVSVVDEGGHGLTDDQYARALEAFSPFYEELGISAPPPPEDHIENYEEQVEALIEARPDVFSFVFGIPSVDVLARCRTAGIKTMGAATTVAEAKALEAAGVDIILATGLEAGGHRPSFLKAAEESLVGTLPLVPQVRDAVSVPVVAAGGIGDARGIKAAFALGADAVQLGTAFLACAESNATDAHRDWLFDNASDDTVLSRVFTGRLARVKRNRFTESAPAPLPFPLQAWFTGVMKNTAAKVGQHDLASLYAGQGSPLLKHRSVEALMTALLAELDPQFS
ncbi:MULTISPECIES: NAD(P)H-dependent flavin oxidoreductase [Kordiimonas]|jgi:nitronate monooxygenase|uniref:NAD(P)H-dependent flavin oxidoreductase n=1 Tax=Kordiimonas TaxID=288021 RepID=UPI00257B6BD9|nr:nitronate monooxygenase [Kordiimonas sp. UBA4487]